jgi:DNA-directed RNA polymerase subunit F
MSTQEILNKEPLSLAEVKSQISSLKKRDTELNFRANKVNEYISSFSIVKQKDAKELFDKISALDVSRLKDIHVKKIIDIMPETEDDVKALLSGYHISLGSDSAKQIADIVKEYLPSKN